MITKSQRVSRPSKRLLEALEQPVAPVRTVPKNKRRRRSKPAPSSAKPAKRLASGQPKPAQSQFADFIDQVTDMQTQTHPARANSDKLRGREPRSLKLQRQMRLIDLDVCSVSSFDDAEEPIFDVPVFEQTQTKLQQKAQPETTTPVTNHSRSNSSSSSMDEMARPWSKFSSVLEEAPTGSRIVDDIINKHTFDHDMLLLRDYYDILDQEESYESYDDEPLPLLRLKRDAPLGDAELMLVSPSSSFNMLTDDIQIPLKVDRESSQDSLMVNAPESPEQKSSDSTMQQQQQQQEQELEQARKTDSSDDLSQYLKLDKTTTSMTLDDEETPKFLFDYRLNNACLNLTTASVAAVPFSSSCAASACTPVSADAAMAVWFGSDPQMVSEADAGLRKDHNETTDIK